METEKKLETMEEELKLIKGELKQSLASVRDYLLNMDLPSSEFASVLEALGDDDKQTITMQGSLVADKPAVAEESSQEEPALEATQEELLEPESPLPSGEEDLLNPVESLEDEPEEPPEGPADEEELETGAGLTPEAEPDEPDEPFMPEAELPIEPELPIIEEEPPMAPGKMNTEVSQSTPKVNLLANLMHWVTKTKKEIGSEQLPAFLEVYGISGHLSPELKEVILQMAEVTTEQPDDGNAAALWSRAMLSLHGILTGGDAPLHPVRPFWHDEDSEIPPDEDEIIEVETDKPEDKPIKLKLVLPNADGQSQEFSLDLKPEAAHHGSQEAPDSREYPNERGDTPWHKPTRKRK